MKVVLCLAFFVCAANALSKIRPLCATACYEIYKPVCGVSSKGQQVEFENDCYFNKRKCEDPAGQWIVSNNGPCPIRPTTVQSCQRMCTMQYTPVCGVNSNGNTQTFSNACAYGVYVCEHPNEGWVVTSQGECPTVQPSCERICTMQYDPVCGVDSNGNKRTFGNSCAYGIYVCEHPNEGWVSQSGEC